MLSPCAWSLSCYLGRRDAHSAYVQEVMVHPWEGGDAHGVYVQEVMVHPGWNSVFPCETGYLGLQQALEEGRMDMELHLTHGDSRRRVSLNQLAVTPPQERLKVVRRLNAMTAVACKQSQQPGDAWDQTMLLMTGMGAAARRPGNVCEGT